MGAALVAPDEERGPPERSDVSPPAALATATNAVGAGGQREHDRDPRADGEGGRSARGAPHEGEAHKARSDELGLPSSITATTQ